MRGLPLLIRLAQQRADESRGDLGKIARASADASAAVDRHDATAANETNLALAGGDVAALAAWTPHSARGRTQLQHRAAELDRSEAAACEALREAIARTIRLALALDAIRAANRRNSLRRSDQQADERELARRAALTPSD